MTTAYLAPYTTQRFFDNNGNPLVGGTVTTYAGGSTTPIATYIDSTGTTPNTNPITLNFRGECSIWLLPNVSYKFVITDFNGNLIQTIDNIVNAALITLYGGVDTGVANSYILNFTSPVPPGTNGQVIFWLPSNSNTGPSTINVNGAGPQPILNPNGSALGANQILAGQFVSIINLNGVWQLYGGSGVGVNVGTFGAEVPLPSATTTDLGSVPGHNVSITGATTITSFGASAQLVAPIYIGRFTGSLILTNSASLILPGGSNITTTAGDAFIAEFMGGGNWRVLFYQYSVGVSVTSAIKATDTPRISTATLANDPDLQITLNLGQYEYELFMLFDSVAAGAGFKFSADGVAVDSRGTSPSGATGFVNAAAYGPKLESFVGATLAYATVSTGLNSNQVSYKGSLLVSTAGSFGIQWAQNSSTASNTTLRAGSYLTATLLAQKTSAGTVQHIYTSPGTAFEIIPANVTSVVVEVFGGSGGGGAGQTASCQIGGGGGGGSGGYSRTTISVAGQAAKTMQYTVAAAGLAGGPGGNSAVISGTFAITSMAANGGGGGFNGTVATGGAGGIGGTASGGTGANTTGNTGNSGLNNAGGGHGGGGAAGVSGVNFGGFSGGNGRTGAGAGFAGNTGSVVFTYT